MCLDHIYYCAIQNVSIIIIINNIIIIIIVVVIVHWRRVGGFGRCNNKLDKLVTSWLAFSF